MARNKRQQDYSDNPEYGWQSRSRSGPQRFGRQGQYGGEGFGSRSGRGRDYDPRPEDYEDPNESWYGYGGETPYEARQSFRRRYGEGSSRESGSERMRSRASGGREYAGRSSSDEERLGYRSSGFERGGEYRPERQQGGWWSEPRSMWERTSDEVASWFGDDEAARRRELDQYRGRHPKNYTRSDDRIREDVCDRLSNTGSIDPADVEVSVQNGEVTLSGTVANRNERRFAEECADDVSGVSYVQNNIRVKQQDIATSRGSTSSFSTSGRSDR